MSEPVYILKLGLENVRCFGEKAELDLSDGKGKWRQWTVIVGDNGLGKTTLLQVLAGLETETKENFHAYFDTGTSSIKHLKYPFLYFLTMLYNTLQDHFKINFTVVFGEKTNEVIISSKNVDITYTGLVYNIVGDHPPLQLFGYGANRFMNYSSLSDLKLNNSTTLFIDDAGLTNAEEWLLQLDYAASRDSELKEFAKQRRELVKEILVELLPDVNKIRFTEPSKDNLTPRVEFHTVFGWVRIHELSLGYKTMVAWMVDLAARMFERYPDSNNPLAEPAIVLVDEIDLHLHPKWQRKIFEYLSEKFPKTQFVVTAHSPLVVQSAPKDANIVVLRKEGDHVVIDNDVASVENWRLDQIMSALYGIESSRGPETEKWLEERRRLKRKQNTLDKDERKRLEELDKQAEDLPTADDPKDIRAMEILREAAELVKRKKEAAQ